jgi:hypothetical protein
MAYMSLNEYWQPFFREIRKFLDLPNSGDRDRLTAAVANPGIPFTERQYLKKIV